MSDYIDKITDKDTGDSRIISPAAEDVRVDNKNFEGSDLDEVLDEVAHAIDEAGSGDGTVTGVKVGSTTYEPTEGVVDLSTPIGNKVDKVTGYGLSKNDYTDTDKAKVDGLKPVATSGSYNDLTDKPTIPTVPTMDSTPTAGNTTHMVSSDGVAAAIAQAGGQVTVTTNGDGTFTIHSGGNDYTVNLNHTHPNMAKLVVDTAANLPDVSEMETDTIYGEVEDGEIAVLYVGGVPFYGGGGSVSTPVLREPVDDSTIDVGRIASGGSSVAKTITVKGKNLTQALTVAVTGTGYSVDKQSIPAADANVGTTLTITCTNTADDAAGTLSLASSEVSCDCYLVANGPVFESLAAVKFTKQQYIETGIHPGPTTRLEIDMQFDGTFVTPDGTTTDYNFIGGGSDSGKIFSANTGTVNEMNGSSARVIIFAETSSSPADLVCQSGTVRNRSTLIIDNVSHQASFNGGTVALATKTTTMPAKMKFGSNSAGAKPFGLADIILYSLKHYENNVLTHNYLPCTRNGVVGLYDTETDTFISSATGTPLVAVNE